jgi:tetratricopeptide (TPR) repeat protein
MFLSARTPSCLRRCFHVVSFVLIAAICAISVNGQIRRGVDLDANNAGNGGAGTITGHIYYPGGRPFDQRISVRLQSLAGEQMTFSNENGNFTFARLSPGTYSIQLDAGKEYEMARETVEIMGQRRSSIGSAVVVPVYINLKVKVTAVEKAGTVDASMAGITDEALKSLKEAKAIGQAGEREKAVELLDKIIGKYPTFMLAHNEKGFQYLQMSQPQKAIEPLEAALKLSPRAFAPRVNYGIALLQSGRLISSILELRQALENHDSSCYAHLYLGVAYLNVDLDVDAEKELAHAIQLGGDDSIAAHKYLGGLYGRQGDKARAADELETYLRLAAKAADAEQVRKAIDGLRKAIEAKK